MKRLVKQVLLASSLIFFSVATYADGKQCNLNSACSVPAAASYVFFPISIDLGSSYTCILAAKNQAKLAAKISSDGDVSFQTQPIEVNRDKPAVKVVLTAKFNGPGRSEIHVTRTSEDKAEALVTCSRTK